jgi:hypothetical protein
LFEALRPSESMYGNNTVLTVLTVLTIHHNRTYIQSTPQVRRDRRRVLTRTSVTSVPATTINRLYYHTLTTYSLQVPATTTARSSIHTLIRTHTLTGTSNYYRPFIANSTSSGRLQQGMLSNGSNGSVRSQSGLSSDSFANGSFDAGNRSVGCPLYVRWMSVGCPLDVRWIPLP